MVSVVFVIMRLAVLVEHRLVTDRQTDKQAYRATAHHLRDSCLLAGDWPVRPANSEVSKNMHQNDHFRRKQKKNYRRSSCTHHQWRVNTLAVGFFPWPPNPRTDYATLGSCQSLTCIGSCLECVSPSVRPVPSLKPNTVTRTPTTKNATETTNRARPRVATSGQRRRRWLRLLPTQAQGAREDGPPAAAAANRSELSILDSVDRLETLTWWCSSWWMGSQHLSTLLLSFRTTRLLHARLQTTWWRTLLTSSSWWLKTEMSRKIMKC